MAADQYPASKIRLKIRFEDFGDEPPVPLLATVGDGPEAFGSGGAFEVSPSDFSRTQDILPKSWHVELNSPRKADTARVTFSLDQLPLDPQVVRSASVQIFAGVISSSDFAKANGRPGAAGYLLQDAVPEGYTGAGMSWELFRGFVDEWTVDYETGEVELTCRDTTSFFIDAKLPENALKAVPKSVKLDEAIRMLIDGSPADGVEGFPGAKGTVVVSEVSRELPRLGEFLGPNWFDSKGRLRKGKRRKPKAPKDMSFWDMITDLCVAAGLKATMRLPRKATTIPGIGAVLPAAELVILDPQTYYDGDGNDLGRRVFCQGINVRDLKVTRRLGGTPVPFIEVRSWDPVAGRQIVGRFPKLATGKKNKPTPTGAGDRAEYEVFTIDSLSGPAASEQAEEIARAIYDQLGRGEFKVRFRTHWTNGIPANYNSEVSADMLLMRPADTIEVYVEPSRVGVTVSSDGEVALAPADELVRRMVARGLSEAFAVRAAAAMRDSRVQKAFRVQTVMLDFAAREGYEWSVEAINYLDARYEP